MFTIAANITPHFNATSAFGWRWHGGSGRGEEGAAEGEEAMKAEGKKGPYIEETNIVPQIALCDPIHALKLKIPFKIALLYGFYQ